MPVELKTYKIWMTDAPTHPTTLQALNTRHAIKQYAQWEGLDDGDDYEIGMLLPDGSEKFFTVEIVIETSIHFNERKPTQVNEKNRSIPTT